MDMKSNLEKLEDYLKIARLHGTTWQEHYRIIYDEVMLDSIDKEVTGIYVVQEFVDYIANVAAYDCNFITEVKTFRGLKEIGASAFEKCKMLEKIELADGLETIRFNAFMECRSLKELIIPDSVKVIGDDFITGCTSLKTLKMSKNIEIMGRITYDDIRNVENLYLPKIFKKHIPQLVRYREQQIHWL